MPSPGDGQDATPGNAMNPRAVSSIVERDPEGLGIAETFAQSYGTADRQRAAREGAVEDVGRPALPHDGRVRRHRSRRRQGCRQVPRIQRPRQRRVPEQLHPDAREAEERLSPRRGGGGVGRTDQYYGVDVGRYNTWRVRGWFSETPHVFTSTYRSLWDGVDSAALTLRGPSPGRHHRREYDPGEHAPGDLVRAGLRSRTDPEEEPGPLRPHAACELESLCQLYPGAS